MRSTPHRRPYLTSTWSREPCCGGSGRPRIRAINCSATSSSTAQPSCGHPVGRQAGELLEDRQPGDRRPPARRNGSVTCPESLTQAASWRQGRHGGQEPLRNAGGHQVGQRLYRFRTRRSGCDLQFGRKRGLRQDRGSWVFVWPQSDHVPVSLASRGSGTGRRAHPSQGRCHAPLKPRRLVLGIRRAALKISNGGGYRRV